MSVNDERRNIGAVCAYVLRDHDTIGSGRVIYTHADERQDEDFIRTFPGDTTIFQYRERAIKAYFNRVAIANELAIMLTYEDADKTIHGLDDADIKPDDSVTGSPKRIYHSLTGIQYNLVANSGSIMFSQKDQQKLDDLTAHFAYVIIRGIDRPDPTKAGMI